MLDQIDCQGVGSATIKRMESMSGVPSGHVRTLLALKSTLEAAGVEFLGSPESAPGVCLMRVEKIPDKGSSTDGR
jgi:hypothetical protein